LLTPKIGDLKMKNKTKLHLLALIALLPLFVGCATPFPMGMLYTELKLPVEGGAVSGKATKIGIAECKSILGMVATGDCSIDAAVKNGNITKIYYVDWEAENILGVIGKYKTIVYGE
jgi:hypothetical protein